MESAVNNLMIDPLWQGAGWSYGWLALLFFFMNFVVIVGVGLFYHRILTHRAAKVNRFVQYFFVSWALPAGTPIQWVGNHRHHHQVSDQVEDAHSPVHHGFWVAHAGWYIYSTNALLCALYTLGGPIRMIFDAFWRPRTNQEWAVLAKDIAADPFYAWVSKPAPYAFMVLLHLVLTWGLVYWGWGLYGLIALYILQTAYFVFGDAVNSLLHMVGDQPFKSGDQSRNSYFLGLLTWGEGFHNTHHAFPASVKVGLLPWQLDIAYEFCRLLEKLGLASDLRVATPKQMLERLQDERYRPYIEKLNSQQD